MLVRCPWQKPQRASAAVGRFRRQGYRWPSHSPAKFASQAAAPILTARVEETVVSQHQHPSPLPPDPEPRTGCSPLPPDPEPHDGCSPLPPDPQAHPPLIRPATVSNR
jgi:hypothetical protein